MKTRTITLSVIGISFLLACHSMEVIIQPKDATPNPLKITVGRIEHRTTGYNPYTADLLRETLSFEFFRLGYAVEGGSAEIKSERPAPGKTVESGSRENRHGGIILTGTVFETSFGDALHSYSSSHIRISIRDDNGNAVGEARYITSAPLSDGDVIPEIAHMLAADIHAKISSR